MEMSLVSDSDLDLIDDIRPLNDEDADCIAELKAVLTRHGKLDRFGVMLLHRHFAISATEFLVESCDETTRDTMYPAGRYCGCYRRNFCRDPMEFRLTTGRYGLSATMCAVFFQSPL